MTFKPTPGFILIAPLKDDFFDIPEEKTLVRIGRVIETGGDIIHASGKILPSPVNKGDVVAFQYVENHDLKLEGEDYYCVQFNLITGVIDGSK